MNVECDACVICIALCGTIAARNSKCIASPRAGHANRAVVYISVVPIAGVTEEEARWACTTRRRRGRRGRWR